MLLKSGGLCPVLLGGFFNLLKNKEATYQEVMGFSSRKRLSSLTQSNMEEAHFLLRNTKQRIYLLVFEGLGGGVGPGQRPADLHPFFLKLSSIF